MARIGFKALQAKIEGSGKSAGAAAAITAAIGRKKYGAKGMAALAAEGKRRATEAASKHKKRYVPGR